MKAGCWVLVTVCLIVGLQTVVAGHGDDHEEGKRARKCGHVLTNIDADDLGMVITNNSITMRKLKAKDCVLARGMECGVPKELRERLKGGMHGKNKGDKNGDAGHEAIPRNNTDLDGEPGLGGPGKGRGSGGPGGEGNQKPGEDRSIMMDGKKVCTSFGKLTEFYIASIELLDDQMAVENSTMDIILSQEDDDTPPTPGVAIPGSQSESGTVSSTYTTISVAFPGRQEGILCKFKLQIYIAAGKGNVTFEDVVSSIEKNDVKWALEFTNSDNCFCNPDGSGCASYIRIKICLKVQNGKKEGHNGNSGRSCADDTKKNCIKGEDGRKIEVSNRVRINGQRVTLEREHGSVSIAEDGCMDIVLSKFNNLFMDPIMAASDELDDLSGDTASNVTRLDTRGFLMFLLAMLASMLNHS